LERNEIKILVVEDEILIAMLLCRSLSLLGYQVCELAATGQDAIRLAKDERPDVVLMDIRLAGPLDGIEAASQIDRECDLSIIFMTGYSDPRVRDRTKALNPAAYLVKPVSPDDVMPIIDHIFAQSTSSI